MVRYQGTLHKLIESASASNSKTKWNQVLHYLEGHTIANNNATNPKFESPLPPYSSPSTELEAELFDQQGPKKEDSPLKIAIRNAPAVVIAALCHLGPEATKLADSRERLPLHWACRRPPDDEDTQKIFQILVESAPETLLHRDDGGRTPLHWLFWYHAPSRSASLVQLFCQDLPVQGFREIRQPRDSEKERYPLPEIPIPDSKKGDFPPNASIIPDSRHGAIPLHYAVMQGASIEALKLLINRYPNSIVYSDRKGRTSLAWYLGAGHLIDNNKRHVCGEANDPNAAPWWHVKLSPTIVQLLISSKVARVVDDMRRSSLHWACHFYARSTLALGNSSLPVKAFQTIVDNNVEALVTQDNEGKTPLHVLFSVVAEQQDQDHQRQLANRTLRDNIDLVMGGPPAFKPAKELIELLLKSPDTDGQDYLRFDTGRDEKKPVAAAYVEDMSGLLPLHNALKVATEPEIIKLLIQSNPTGLIHASEEELQTPLVHAFNSEYTAPLQPIQTFDLLMAAYVTSRHGTFIDGRVSLKMEDTNGNYPLHYACRFQASTDIIKMFIDKFPHCAVHQNSEGDLPVHCLLSDDCLFDPPPSGVHRGASLARHIAGLQTDKEIAWQKKIKEAYRDKMRILIEPLRSKKYLKLASSAHGMTPLHIAVAFRAVPYTTLYRMLDTYPEAAVGLTTVKGYEFSCLDLHEMSREEADDTEEWDAVRELLFAFNPMLEEYRHRDELLDACVQMIRNEIFGKGSYHLQQIQGNHITNYASLELKDTLSSIDMPEIDVAYRPRNRKNKTDHTKLSKKKTIVKPSPSMKLTATFSFGVEKKVEKSIYDDDLDDRYVVSPENSMNDDDEDDFLSSDDEDEEYVSDDDSASGTDEGTSFDQSTNKSSWDRGLSSGPSGTYTESVGTHKSAISPRSATSSPSKTSIRSLKNKQLVKQASPGYAEEKKEEKSECPRNDLILSEVAMRLWFFFVLYHDHRNPDDNYAKQVEAITEEVEFEILEKLVGLPVPAYAEAYLDEGTTLKGVTLGDVASPSSKAIFRSYQYFLGKYEFPTELDGILLHRSSDGNTVYLRATEHVLSTKEYLPKEVFAPGEAEEAIWQTGENVEEKGGYVASTFVDKKRLVCIKVTKNQEAYDNEVQCRKHLGLARGEESLSNILPLFGNYAASSDDKNGRKYLMDVNDERFRTVTLFGGESICLSEFPYALIYPHSDEGDLFDFFYHHGLNGMDDVSDIGRQVAAALKMLHEKGIVHGNISMRQINMVPLDDETVHRTWLVSEFSTATRSQNDTAFMGTISQNGSAQFKTGLLPPEMFVKLTSAEARTYQTYWEMVERLYNVKVDKQVVEPFVNMQTGATYVLRCHFIPDKEKTLDVSLPELPYQLVAARESTDVWCFGLLLFTLCSGGRPLFPSNLKTGHLLDYESIVGWSREKASAQIYEHIHDPIAQDLLLYLLAPFEDRVELSMEIVLNHPFFNRGADASKLLGKMIDKRQHESAAYDRQRQKVVSEKTEDNWLDSRTTTVTCWNFDLLRRFNFSSTEIISKMLGQRAGALSMPCNFILLPYKLSSKNKKAKLAPTTKKDVERAERMGVLLLSLAKSCFFGYRVKMIVEKAGQKHWTATSLLEELGFSDVEFQALKEDFIKIAASQVEAFRANPISAVLKLIERRVTEIRKFFKEAGKAFLYLVDEYAGVPLVGASYAPYPLEVAQSIIDKFLVRALPFMHVSAVYARGVAGGVSGLVRLIFEAAYPHVPPSWTIAGSGMTHDLDEHHFIQEVSLLREALGLLYSTKENYLIDDLRFVRDSCLKIDTHGNFADMQRVSSAGLSLWTTKEGAAEIQESCKLFSFNNALEIQNTLENQLRTQEQQIKKLQEEVERLKFRKDLNLDVPESSSSTSTRIMSNKASSLSVLTKTPKTTNASGSPRKEDSPSRTVSPQPSIPMVVTTTTPKAVVHASGFPRTGEPDESSSFHPTSSIPTAATTPKVANTSSSPKSDDVTVQATTCSSNKSNGNEEMGDPSIMSSKGTMQTPASREVEQEQQDEEGVVVQEPTSTPSPTESSTEEQFFDSKEPTGLELQSYDGTSGMGASKEERDAGDDEDASICKSEAESLREIMSLD